MTKEELIKHLKICAEYCVVPSAEAFDMVFKALEQNTVSQETYDSEYLARKQAEQKLYEIEQNTSDDCVSIQAVKEGMRKYGFHSLDMTITEFIEDELPPVTPTRKVGKWIGEEEGYYSECSCCGASFLWEDYKCIGDWKYCPNCGADIRGNENEKDTNVVY